MNASATPIFDDLCRLYGAPPDRGVPGLITVIEGRANADPVVLPHAPRALPGRRPPRAALTTTRSS